MSKSIRIGTRDSQLAVWQATQVQQHLKGQQIASELVFIKSEGDLNTVTPIYELGVIGVFTKTLDAALLNHTIDVAVHSMKDVPVQLAGGLQQAAVLKRASSKDILVFRDHAEFLSDTDSSATIATSSIRRMAQWRNRYPKHHFENLRGNINTRLQKVQQHHWNGAIFAAAGLERIGLRPATSVDLDWMVPAPAQGAILVVCRKDDPSIYESCQHLNDETTALCVKMERDFLQTLDGGCSTPISALAEAKNGVIFFKGNMVSPDGKTKIEMERSTSLEKASSLGHETALEILEKGGREIMNLLRKNGIHFYDPV